MVKAKKGKNVGKDDDIDDENNTEVSGNKGESRNKSQFDSEENYSKKADKKVKKNRREEESDSEDDRSNKKKDRKSGRIIVGSDEEEYEKAGKKGRKKDVNAGAEDEISKLNKKKSKKDRKKFDFDDNEENEDDTIRAGIKKRHGGNRDDSEDEEDRRGKGKTSGKARKRHEESDEKEGDDDVRKLSKDVDAFEISRGKKKKGKNKSRGDNDEADSEDEFAKAVKSKSQKQKGFESDGEDDVEKTANKSKAVEQEKGGKKGKKNRKKRDDDDDEDIEKALAELELEYAGLKPKEEAVKTESEPAEEKISKKSKKGKRDRDEENEYEYGSVTAEESSRKKKEKSKKSQKKEENERDNDIRSSLRDRDDDDDKRGKRDKKKKDEKEKKGPGKKTLAAMQEALKKIREEEERFKREEEERIKREEEAEAARQEALRIEREKKEKKKQKEKDRKERLKAEGKLLTAKQKADKARAQELISALKAQGLELPDPGEKKPRPGTRVRPSKLKPAAIQESDATDSAEREALTMAPEQVQVEIVDTKMEAKEESDSDDVKDNWDSDSSGEDISERANEKRPMMKEETASKESAPEEESESESEEEEEDEEDEDEEEEEESSEEESGSEDEHKTDAERRREKALARIEKRREEADSNRNPDNLRAAVVCVLGHVDTGKTKILDKLRRTHVQDGEAGGITQQIGATNVPIDNIKETCKLVKGFSNLDLKIPGLLIIDTPGHESFSNLRSRGSSLCDIAILVVDIMHGLEPQTIESINLLKSRKTPFIVALNKIDRLYNWQTGGRKDIRDILKSQADNTQLEFKQRTQEVTVQFAEQGLNAALFFENPDLRSYVSLVPTSAITGEGMGNLLALIVELSQTMLAKRLMYSEWLLATVLEVKAIPGLGTTIDAILINGKMKEGDTMILAGTDGPIVTQIRSLLMPQPMKELRVKNAYVEYKEIKAAQGVKIAAKDLEKAIAGLNLQIAEKPDEVPIFCDEVSKELKNALSSIKLKERGVYVQASTLGSLEALLEFLRTSKIPYSGIRIGPVVKKDVMKASIMLEHESQYATILAFDVKVERDAQELADSLGVKIFQADIIYHLFDKFMAYREELKQKKRDEFKHVAVFPCKLRVLPQFVFNTRDPIVVGVMVEAGVVREGTPLCVPSKEFINLGIVTSVEVNHKPLEAARKGMEVCVKIENPPGETPKLYGRHFDHTDMLISKISRQSIDACKDYFRDDLTKQDWQLMVELKKLFQIL